MRQGKEVVMNDSDLFEKVLKDTPQLGFSNKEDEPVSGQKQNNRKEQP
jgi:hypothetical protein